MIVMFDASTGLAEHGIRLRDARAGNHKVICPNCSHSRRKKNDPCLSVTIEADGRAVWNCHHCQWTGATGSEGFRPAHARRTYRKPEREANPQRTDQLNGWFAKRGITSQTVEQFGIYKTRKFFPQTEREEDCIAFPYEWRGQLRNVKYRTANKQFRQEKDPEPVFFNADSIAAGEDLIICEGEIDVMTVVQVGFPHVVSLANGAPDKEEGSDKRYEPFGLHWEELKHVRRVLIATDMDGPGELLSHEIARRMGKDRCFRVRMPTINDAPCKDANECLVQHGEEVLRECIEHAEPWPLDGLHDTASFEVDVLDLYHGRGPRPQSTGFHAMDEAFRFIPGQFIAVTGIPNHGKSRWLDQVAVQTARLRNDKWAMFSPETGDANHIADLCEIWAGRPFFDGPTMRMTERELRDAQAWVRERFFFIGSADHTPSIDWVLERARAAVLRHGVNHLVIDPYNEIEASRPDKMTETEFVSQLISKCKRFGQHHDVTVWMIIHPTKLRNTEDGREPVPGLYDLAGSAHWRNKADAGLVVYRDYEQGETWVFAKKIRRQPVCGRPGGVKFLFLNAERRFECIPGSFQELGKRAA
jgi:twinkle protein